MMRFATTVTTPAALLPISVGEAKDYAKVEVSDDDVIIDDLIRSSTSWAEGFTRRAFINRTITMSIDWCFPDVIELPLGPASSITAANFTYVDSDGDTTQVPTTVYDTDFISDPARIYLAHNQVWPINRIQRNAISVEFVAGYGSKPNDIPTDIRQAILMMVTYHYEVRQPHAMGIGATTVSFPKTVDSLLLPYAVMS
jgi:uncharacterized phiE125 gp8 family phage protein